MFCLGDVVLYLHLKCTFLVLVEQKCAMCSGVIYSVL